ncbi:MAG TPA: hypothetical protein VHK91_15915 [Flavisolibacter sp.]|jgi:hypothetical protein|nr:hypothetical protein [Flavisolibacter sp.]
MKHLYKSIVLVALMVIYALQSQAQFGKLKEKLNKVKEATEQHAPQSGSPSPTGSIASSIKTSASTPFQQNEIVLYMNPEPEENPDDLVNPGGWITGVIMETKDLDKEFDKWKYGLVFFHRPTSVKHLDHKDLSSHPVADPAEFAAVRRLLVKMDALKKNVQAHTARQQEWIYIVTEEMNFIEKYIPEKLCPSIGQFMENQKKILEEQITLSNSGKA